MKAALDKTEYNDVEKRTIKICERKSFPRETLKESKKKTNSHSL